MILPSVATLGPPASSLAATFGYEVRIRTRLNVEDDLSIGRRSGRPKVPYRHVPAGFSTSVVSIVIQLDTVAPLPKFGLFFRPLCEPLTLLAHSRSPGSSFDDCEHL